MQVGDLVKMPSGRFWWNGKVGIISETRTGQFMDCMGEWSTKKECRVDFGDEFIWYHSANMEVISEHKKNN